MYTTLILHSSRVLFSQVWLETVRGFGAVASLGMKPAAHCGEVQHLQGELVPGAIGRPEPRGKTPPRNSVIGSLEWKPAKKPQGNLAAFAWSTVLTGYPGIPFLVLSYLLPLFLLRPWLLACVSF